MTSAVGAWRIWLLAVAVGLTAVAVAGTAALTASTATAPPAALRSCWELFVPLLTWRSIAALLLGATSSVVVLAAIGSFGRQLWASHCYTRSHQVDDEVIVDGERVRIVADPRPLAFTLGVLRPRIYVSAGARERMTVEQFSAVVAHEAHHRRRHDPLRLMATRALAAALFFVPVCRALAVDHAQLVEVDADAAAVTMTGSKKALAGALLLFADSGAAAGAGIGVERVDALAGDRRRIALPLTLLAAGLSASFTIVAIGFLMGLGGADPDGAHLPGMVEQACILARALLPLGIGALVLAVVAARHRSQPRAS
jgi:Zn-dependent protease with chaperone function